ncbi:MAG: GAP family protein [Solirubrobacteraceae bacterium]
MPPQTLALALGASIYPPAVAAVIALGRGTDVRPRVLAFVLAAAAATYAVGALLLFLLSDLGASGAHHRTPSAAVDMALGVALIALALYLRRRWSTPREAKPAGESKVERYLQSRRLAFALGVILYALPSPIYLAAVKGVADANLSTSGQLAALAVTVAVMLWLIELPMLMLLVVPERATSTLEQINAWFARNGRGLVLLACLGAGAYLLTRGLVDLPG